MQSRLMLGGGGRLLIGAAAAKKVRRIDHQRAMTRTFLFRASRTHPHNPCPCGVGRFIQNETTRLLFLRALSSWGQTGRATGGLSGPARNKVGGWGDVKRARLGGTSIL